jgi:putative ABC transport system permease protein
VATAAGVAVAVALLASIGAFLSASKATMTSRALSRVSVDWQVQVQAGADPAAVLGAIDAAPHVTAAEVVGFAGTTGLTATTDGSTQTTGPGVVVGVPEGWRGAFVGEVRDLVGASGGVLLAQQTAANLHAGPGDVVAIGRGGLAPVSVTVDGVIDLPQADSLFQRVGAPAGAQPQAPPDNVVLVPAERWHQLFDPLGATHPESVHTQIHVRLDHRLPADPAAAYATVLGQARNLEIRTAGAGVVGDNLAAVLDAARGDALYAQVLFVFLGLPGALLAGLLTAAVAGAGAERRRREQALLRARGASTRQLVVLGSAEAAVVGALGALTGLLGALAIGRVAFGTVGFGATTTAGFGWAGAAALVGLGIAAATVGVPAWRDARWATVATGRRGRGRPGSPRWWRFGLDLWLLGAGVLVFWLSGRGGYQLVLAPEGVPAISVSYWAFAGPALVWSGAGLLAWRLADLVLLRGRRRLGRLLRPLAGSLSSTVAATMSRQRRLLARGLVLVAVSVSFAASTAVFNSTYRQQSEVDARLTNGGDVTVTEPPGASVGPGAAVGLAQAAGVASVEPIQHRYAYVGADLQDLFGVRPTTVVAATKLQDAYFAGGSARQLMATLATKEDSVLVSAETARDFQLQLGDAVTLRLQDGRTKALVPVTFHYAGVANEFPTAPKDSFLVANADYVARMTGSDDVGAFLIDTGTASPAAVAARVRAGIGPGAVVSDIATSRRVVGSSLTAVDLAGLTRVELGFALVLAAASTGLVLALGLAERRRTFAIAGALGASGRQLGSFVWAEAGFVALGGLTAGAAIGATLSHILGQVLTGVFDPSPAALAVPWAYLGLVAATALAAVAAAASGTIRWARHPTVAVLRDL